jgi:hypothetical protein
MSRVISLGPFIAATELADGGDTAVLAACPQGG